MIRAFTPDRAEKMAAAMERQGLRVERLLSEQPAISSRGDERLMLTTHVYARVWKGDTLRLNITYERIDSGSVML